MVMSVMPMVWESSARWLCSGRSRTKDWAPAMREVVVRSAQSTRSRRVALGMWVLPFAYCNRYFLDRPIWYWSRVLDAACGRVLAGEDGANEVSGAHEIYVDGAAPTALVSRSSPPRPYGLG